MIAIPWDLRYPWPGNGQWPKKGNALEASESPEAMSPEAQSDVPAGYPLVNCHIAMENPPIFNGKIHYFYDHFQ